MINAWLIRRYHSSDYLLHFFVSAVTAVLVTRAFLTVTHGFQLTIEALHIAHVLYGGLFLTISVMLTMLYLGRRALLLSSICGGVGFGLFVDEIGKFITKDNDYLFQPVAVIVYVIFVALFFLLKRIRDSEKLSAEEKTYNKRLAFEGVTTPSFLMKVQRWMRFQYMHVAKKRWFQLCIHGIFLAYMVLVLVYGFRVAFGLVQRVLYDVTPPALLRFYNEQSRILISSVGLYISNALAALCIVIAWARMKFSRSAAYGWYERATIIWLLFTQLFVFYQDQFSAVFSLAGTLLLFGAVRYMREEELRGK